MVKVLLTFGAEVNPLNNLCQTPLDFAISRESCNLVAILVSVGGKTGDAVLKEDDGGPDVVPQLEPFDPVSERSLVYAYIYKNTTHCFLL